PADADSPPAGEAPKEESKPEPEEEKEEPKAEEKSEAPKAAPAKKAAKPAPAKSSGGRVKASPLARRIAEERGVDLNRINGTGPGGRIVKADVDNAPAGGGGGSNLGLLPVSAAAGDETIALSGMRRVIAQRLLESK